jgi:hypothetical protein
MSISIKLTIYYLAALLTFAVLGFLLYRTMSPSRRIEFQISLLIQLLGTVAFGAVVTYSLYQIQHSQEAEEKQRNESALAASNKTRVLAFIKDELAYDLASLKNRDGSINLIQLHPLKSDYWRIAGLSGDLKWIEDAELLNAIAQAYFEIENNSAWESRYVEASIGTGSTITLTFGNGQQLRPQAFLSSMLSQSYASAKSAIEAALKRL